MFFMPCYIREGVMPRNSRVVVVGYPHHVTQRGNNREPVFFDDEDRWAYLNLLGHYTQKYQVDIWAYCLMTNHVHLLAVPREPAGLSGGVGLVNMTYTQYLNRRHQRTGRIWQNRFFSAVVDSDQYVWSVARYIEKNPVAAGLVDSAENYQWSSARHHLQSQPDQLLKVPSWLKDAERDTYRAFLTEDDKRMTTMIRQATRSGRSVGGTLPEVSLLPMARG
jgi:putative transposase